MDHDRQLAVNHRPSEELATRVLLLALGDGRALTAAELARSASLATALVAKLLAELGAAGRIEVVQQGPHRYHRLREGDPARSAGPWLPSAAQPETRPAPAWTGPRDPTLRAARTCHGHLAGGLGVALADALTARGEVVLTCDQATVTTKGMAMLAQIGIDPAPLASPHARAERPLCRPCLDWSERRLHLGGRLGAALCAHALERGWIRRVPGTRAVTVTPAGRRGLQTAYGVRV